MPCTIYKVTNKVNGKCYTGFDSRWPNRKSAHIHAALKKNAQQPLERAIRKYGAEKFDWISVYQSNDVDFTKNIMEGYLIELHRSHVSHGGYNVTRGGEGALGRICSEFTKRKIGLANSHKIWSPEEREKLSAAHRGKRLSKLHVENVSRALAKNYLFVKDGVTIQIHNLAEFCRINKLSAGNMNSLYHGRLKTAYGYQRINNLQMLSWEENRNKGVQNAV